MRRLLAIVAILLGCSQLAFSQQSVSYTQAARQTAAWTSATSGNARLAVSVSNLSSVIVTFVGSSTMTGGAITFEVDDNQDNTNWFTQLCMRRDTATAESTYTLSVASQAWTCDVRGMQRFAVRLSTTITGSGTASIAVIATASPAPLAQQPTSSPDGSNSTLGALADAAAGDATGSVNAHLRQIAKTLVAGITTTPASNASVNVSQIGGTSAASTPASVGAYAVVPFAGTLKSGVTSAMTGTTSTQVIAGVASNTLYLSACSVTNTSTTGTLVNLQDGSGGTTLYTLVAPAAAASSNAGQSMTFPVPLKVPTQGNGLYAANVTTSSSVILSCNGYYTTASF